jgi:diaminopimelate decarboxylase
MQAFTYLHGLLHVERVSLEALAHEYGTPLYIYSQTHLRQRYDALVTAMADVSPLICYSVKANSNRAVIDTFRQQGAGVDIVSGGELFRALRARVDPSKIVFAGVGKTREDIEYALKERILFFTVESEQEALRISDCAEELNLPARVAFRVNPDVDAKTHKYVSTGKKENKFGMDIERTAKVCEMAAGLPHIDIVGLQMHIGSQILTAEPFAEALQKLQPLCRQLAAAHSSFKYIDIGGGIGIQYEPEHQALAPTAFADAVLPALKDLGLQVIMEPGRYLVGNAGALVCRVQYVKDNAFKRFIIADAGMNDLLRPALYQSYHEVLPVRRTEERVFADLVGPICESGDFLAQERELPDVEQDDLLAVMSAGAYGASMSSTYNSRPRPPEVMVDGDKANIIRERESWDDLVRNEA